MSKWTPTAQKMKFLIEDFFSRCDKIHKRTMDLVIFTEETPNQKLQFFVSVLLLPHRKGLEWITKNFYASGEHV